MIYRKDSEDERTYMRMKDGKKVKMKESEKIAIYRSDRKSERTYVSKKEKKMKTKMKERVKIVIYRKERGGGESIFVRKKDTITDSEHFSDERERESKNIKIYRSDKYWSVYT